MGVRKHGHNRRSGSSKTYMIWAEMLVRCRRLTGIKADTLYMRLHRGKDLSPWTIR